MKQSILNSIEQASASIGKTWPLYTFVASNPLAGYEKTAFKEALKLAKSNFNATVFPAADLFRQAWELGDIDQDTVRALLEEKGLFESPEHYLAIIGSQSQGEEVNPTKEVDRIMAKWLAAFMDEGLSEWSMPYKSEGFYAAWRLLAIYDSELGNTSLRDIPKSSMETLELILKDIPESDYSNIFTYHLAALPGWTGYINHRKDAGTGWHQDYPITLMDYLAVRLWTAKKIGLSIVPEPKEASSNELMLELQYLWLKAWEQSWQKQMLKTLEREAHVLSTSDENEVPDAQMVFCIDTRSELIRRHVEASANYETFGYAGFFGIAMDYQNLDYGIIRKSCPPIVSSAYTVSESAKENKEEELLTYQKRNSIRQFTEYFLKRMKNMLPSAFGYVEGSGFFYGLSLIMRTMIPGSIYRMNDQNASKMEGMCEPNIAPLSHEHAKVLGIPLKEKVGIVKAAFDLMGWKEFAPIVLFVGHGSHSANNPFASSLDCGACAASPGRHNARMLAKLANEIEVRQVLADVHDILIPADTIFIGAEHNTTTDEIVLFDSEFSQTHKQALDELKANLSKAQKTATQDRLGLNSKSIRSVHQKANNWSETRPEWGLAKNAAFIVAPRKLTANTNLEGRCFLHSYDWEKDSSGKALEGIMQGPMVVTQWINNHYYFSTVDNNTFGGGSKITHNITGKYGVVQGNGGDLKTGLPLQSLYGSDEAMYHQPLRLTVMIQAPINRVSEILLRNKQLMTLLDNEWIYLMVMDPTHHNEVFKYERSIKWVPASANKQKAAEKKRVIKKEIQTEFA